MLAPVALTRQILLPGYDILPVCYAILTALLLMKLLGILNGIRWMFNLGEHICDQLNAELVLHGSQLDREFLHKLFIERRAAFRAAPVRWGYWFPFGVMDTYWEPEPRWLQSQSLLERTWHVSHRAIFRVRSLVVLLAMAAILIPHRSVLHVDWMAAPSVLVLFLTMAMGVEIAVGNLLLGAMNARFVRGLIFDCHPATKARPFAEILQLLYLVTLAGATASYLWYAVHGPEVFNIAAPLDMESVAGRLSAFATFAYFAVGTLATVGYGDIVPASPGCRALLIIYHLLSLGVLVFSIQFISEASKTTAVDSRGGRLREESSE